MKNKLYYIMLAILMCFSFLETVNADDFNVIVSANANNNVIEKGKEVEITINVKSDSAVDLCSFNVTSSSTLEYVSMQPMGDWQIYSGTIADFTMENNINNIDPLTSGVDIIKIKYRVNDSGKVTISPRECAFVASADSSDDDTQIDSIDIQITAQEPVVDTTLSNISVSGGKMAPAFSSDIYSYIVHLDSSVFGLAITANNSEFQDDIVVKGNDERVYTDLDNITFRDDNGEGEMVLRISIDDGTSYSLIFVIPKAEELDNSLTSLTINGEDIGLEAGKLDYVYIISKNATNFNFGATLKDSDNFQFNSNCTVPGVYNIGENSTYLELIVEPKDPSIGAKSVTYNIEVKKESKPSSGTTNNGGSSNKPNNNSNNDANKNPQTGDISMFIMLIILISSLIGSIVLYQKNLENYR